ncbi:MAG: hypothetical protein K0R94_662, partial [Burkholderiales bacterium]|nr:hypothetical protein [Burkholderiales bacterium]
MKKAFLILPCLAVVVGCSSIETNPQSSKVLVSHNKPPKGCKYIGEAVGNQGNFVSGAWTSNANLEKGAMNDLRNKANEMGANYVQLTTSRA